MDKNVLKKLNINIRQDFQTKIKDILVQHNIDIKDLIKSYGLDSKKGYELRFLGKDLAYAMASTPSQKVLKHLYDFKENSQNIIIKGDNLDALKILKAAYHESIKCIYIDPPYNTGNDDFIYNDNKRKDYKNILIELGLLNIDENGTEIESEDLKYHKDILDSRSHSGWLAFMLPRLKLAKELLRDDGVIFISIDDNEQATLKLLCDEIFGEDNFVACVPRLTSAQRSGQEYYMNISHDYILIYSYAMNFNNPIARQNLDKNKIQQDKNGYFIKGDTKAILASQTQGYSKGGDYDFEYNGKIYKPINSKGERNRWLWNLERMQAAADLGILVETKNSLRMQIYIDKKFDEKTNTMIDKDENLIFHTADLMMSNKFTNTTGTKELEKIFNQKIFDTPKPINLIKTLLKLATTPNSNDIILDFFAGSGTTGQAVMELNEQDNGNRSYILVQLDEAINETKNKIAYDFCKNTLNSPKPVISDITIERIKRASQKINKGDIGFRLFCLEDAPNEIIDDEGLKLIINSDLSSYDKAINLALASGMKLDKELNIIIKDKLYNYDNAYYIVSLDDEVINILKENKGIIYINGYEDYDLQDFLNLHARCNNIEVIY